MVPTINERILHQMKVTILQLDIACGHPEENIRRAEALMAQQPDSDLYVLPEMWSTGFATEPAHIAEDESTSVSLQWMKSTARQFQCAICGSLAIKTANGVYKNRHYFVNGRTGYVSYYDKSLGIYHNSVFLPATSNENYTAVYGYDKLGAVYELGDAWRDCTLEASVFTS